jgi:membrane protease YdiL (CAAX protease family)
MQDRTQHKDFARFLTGANAIRAVAFAIGMAYLAGETSTAFATISVQKGGPGFLREPLNLCIAVAALLVWQKWSAISLYAKPKLGSVTPGIIGGLGLGLALPALALVIMVATGIAQFKLVGADAFALLFPIPFLILHGFAEETMIRGVAQRMGQTLFGPGGGILLAALAFSGLQFLQGYDSLWHVINSFLFASALGALALCRGGLIAAAVAHAAWTWLETIALGTCFTFEKLGGFWAGSGPDSYGSPIFSVVIIAVGLVFQALQLRSKQG